MAVEGSTRSGWPPARYREAGAGFIVRRMSVAHDREAVFGEPMEARTWVRPFRREMFSTREVRLLGAGGSIARGTQQWVHVDASLRPVRAGAALLASFPPHEGGASVALPSFGPLSSEASTHRFEFDVWHAWMDPLDHVNHPAYLEFADEATSRVMHAAGLSPSCLRPLFESVTFRAGVRAGDRVLVQTRPVGYLEGGPLVLSHHVSVAQTLCAELLTIRCLEGGENQRLWRAFGLSERSP